MTLTWSAESKKAANDARTVLLNTGVLKLYKADGTSLLATLAYSATAFGASTSASPSVATANVVTNTTPASNALGTIGYARAYKSDGTTEVWHSDNVTTTGGGGDVECSSLSCDAGITITVTSHTITQG